MDYYDAVLKTFFGFINMPIHIFGNSSSSHYNGNKIDTSFFVQESCWWNICIESDIEEDIAMENQFRIESLPDFISVRDAALKKLLDNKFNNPSIIKHAALADFNNSRYRSIC